MTDIITKAGDAIDEIEEATTSIIDKIEDFVKGD